MALESAVHRYDAELAVGSPAPIDRDLAVDGIDEWLGVHLATDVPETPDASLGGVLCLACADDPAAWTVEVAGGRLRWREGRGPADAVLVGSASDLYLFSWNRTPLEALDLTGKPRGRCATRSLTSVAWARAGPASRQLGAACYEPLGDRGRDDLVMVVANGEPAPPAGQRAKVGRVALDLRGRHERDHDLLAPFAGLGAEHPAPARVEITQNVALIGGRHRHLEPRDGLEHHRARSRQRLLEADASRHLEAHLGRVDGVVLAVVAGHPNVDDRVAEVAAGRHRLLDALFHRRDELAGDRAADDRVDEDEAFATLERLDPQVCDAELAVTAGLLLVLALGLGGLGDRLPVRDLDAARSRPPRRTCD